MTIMTMFLVALIGSVVSGMLLMIAPPLGFLGFASTAIMIMTIISVPTQEATDD